MLTGATGSFGSELLQVLSADPNVAHVYALVRQRATSKAMPKVSIIQGDVASADLGLAATVVEDLSAQVTGIVHAAADTRFTAPPAALRRTNVGGTEHTLKFAKRCGALERVCILSSVHVAGARTGRVCEDELEHDAGFVNFYEQSKYEAELLARRWMAELPLAVVRLSTVVGTPLSCGHSTVALHQAIRLMFRSLAPMVPGRADSPVDLVAADYAARATAWLATHGFEPGRTFHVVAGRDTITQSALIDLTMETFIACKPTWRSRAIARPALVDLDTFELFRRSVEDVGEWMLRDSTAVIASFAPQLAYPKVFDDERCRRALAGSGVERTPVRPAFTRMVRQLIGA